MRIKCTQDLMTGLMFAAIGLAALWFGAELSLGTAQRPGTGLLPRVLAWLLIGTGAILFGKSLVVDGPGLGVWAWRPLIMVTLATIAFALLIDGFGLVAAMLASDRKSVV